MACSWPRLADVIRMMWDKASVFLREAGTVILACTIVLWALLYYNQIVTVMKAFKWWEESQDFQLLRGQLEFDIGERANLRFVAGYSEKDGDCCSPDVLPGAVSTRFLGLLGRPVATNEPARTAHSTHSAVATKTEALDRREGRG